MSLSSPSRSLGRRSQRRRDGARLGLGVAIQALDVAKETSNVSSAQLAFSSISVLLTAIRVLSLLLFDK